MREMESNSSKPLIPAWVAWACLSPYLLGQVLLPTSSYRDIPRAVSRLLGLLV